MAFQNNAACTAADNRTGAVLSTTKNEAASLGSDEITITIRNGTVVKFVQNVYYTSLEGVNGDGI